MNIEWHLPTLLLISITLNLLIAALLWWIHRLRERQNWFRLWAFSCGAFAFGSLLASARVWFTAPWMTEFLALGMLALSPLLLLLGLHSFCRLPARRQRKFQRVAMAAFIVYLALIAATFISAPNLSRGITALFSALVFSIAAYRLAAMTTRIQLPVRVLQVLFIIHGALMLGQTVIIAMEALGLGLQGLDTLLRAILINHILLATVTALALPLMAFTRSENRLRNLAERDGLTGLYNRRSVLREGTRAFSRAVAGPEALAVLMLDLDHFKRINDQLGHAGGDEVLRLVARTLENELRDNDIVGRIGGEEFVIILPLGSAEDFTHIANRLLSAIALGGSQMHGEPLALSASIGGIELAPRHKTLADMLVEADAALYRAKHKGRNRAEFISPKTQTATV